ncbi:MAG: hypothetical protein HQL82_01210 [Magnetococcales bacterium]|nr:hypothetical protein [Magnetococcales bacterium]
MTAMFRYVLVLLLLLCAGAGVGRLLLPTNETLALMYLRDQDYDEARKLFQKDFTVRGGTSATTIIPLANLYLQQGDVNAAILTVEAFLEQNPRHLEARKRIGTYYQFAQRPGDYLRNLERIVRLEPTRKNLEELASLYNYHSRHDDQIRVLRELTERFPEEPSHFVSLSQLLATRGHKGEGADVLLSMRREHLKAFTPATHRLLVELLLDSGRAEEAFEAARQRTIDYWVPLEALALADLLHYRGGPEWGWRFVTLMRERDPDSERILIKWTELAIQTGRSNEPYQLLLALKNQNRLPETAAHLLTELALADRKLDLAMEVARLTPPERLPGWLATQLAEQAVLNKRTDLAEGLVAHLGRPFLEQHPLLAAELALARNREGEARVWLGKAGRNLKEPAERMQLAQVLLRLQQVEEGMMVVEDLLGQPQLPTWMLRDLTGHMVAQKRAERGLALITALRRSDDRPEVQEAWALLAVHAGGREPEVMAWLASRTDANPGLLADIANVALDTKQSNLALAAARRLVAQAAGPEHRVILARAQLAAGHPVAALEQFRQIGKKLTREQAAIHGEALLAAWRQGHHDRKALGDWLQQSLAEAVGPERVEERRALAFVALESGFAELAQETFMALAATAAFDSPEVAQLGYLWGPRPGSRALDWLEARAETEQPDRKHGWLNMITDLGAPERVLTLVARYEETASVVDAHLRALSRLKKKPAIDQLLRRQVSRGLPVPRLDQLAAVAEAEELPETAALIYQKALEADGTHHLALQRLGYMAFFDGEWKKSVSLLQRYLRYHPDKANYEPHLYIAEVFWAQGELEQAKPYYLDALEKIAANPDKPYTVRVAKVRMLQRMGWVNESLKGYEDLLREKPDDLRVKADYVELLLARKKVEMAQNVMRKVGVR